MRNNVSRTYMGSMMRVQTACSCISLMNGVAESSKMRMASLKKAVG